MRRLGAVPGCAIGGRLGMVNVTLSAKQELLRRKVGEVAESRELTLRIVPGGTDEPVLVPDIRRVEDEAPVLRGARLVV